MPYGLEKQDQIYRIVVSAGQRGIKTHAAIMEGIQVRVIDTPRALRQLQGRKLIRGIKIGDEKQMTWYTKKWFEQGYLRRAKQVKK